MEHTVKQQLNKAIKLITEDIKEQENNKPWHKLSEEEILFELVLSILGSQIKYEVALQYAQVLKKENILTTLYSEKDILKVQLELEKIFETPQHINGSIVKYRFPKTRAKYIAFNLFYLQQKNGITSILSKSTNTKFIRKYLVKHIKGIGPKQASHFLRNIGFSNDIAVLDVHILRYMNIQGVINEEYKSIGNLKLYEKLEEQLVKFLEFILAPIGYIDQAIWIVMRVYQREYLNGNR